MHFHNANGIRTLDSISLDSTHLYADDGQANVNLILKVLGKAPSPPVGLG